MDAIKVFLLRFCNSFVVRAHTDQTVESDDQGNNLCHRHHHHRRRHQANVGGDEDENQEKE